jgi:hypothetical protein
VEVNLSVGYEKNHGEASRMTQELKDLLNFLALKLDFESGAAEI